jgi:ABC-type transporter Mla subunit MlaD
MTVAITIISICLVLFGSCLGMLISHCINNQQIKSIMETQQELAAALNAAKEQIESLTLSVQTANAGIVKIGTETDGLIDAVNKLTEQLGNQGGLSEEVKSAIAGVQTAIAAASEAVAETRSNVEVVDAKVTDAEQ